MQVKNTVSVLFVLLVLVGCGTAQPATVPVVLATTTPPGTATILVRTNTLAPTKSVQFSGPYLGQKLPGSFSTRFAPAFIKGELHTSPVFMPDGSEVYWSSQEPRIYTMKMVDGQWTQPESISFSHSLTDYRDPFISPSGDKLFFLSKGRLPNSQLPAKENIWFVERVGDGWGEPQPLGEAVNTLTLHWQISVAANGNLYFTSGETGFEDIYVSKYIDHQYVRAEPLGDPINTEQFENTPYIAPDESSIIFARAKDQSSYPRLYISYADENHNWGEPILIESVSYGLCPVVSPDGKYLFFLSSPQSVSWMQASFIEELKPQANTVFQGSVPISPDTAQQVKLIRTLAGHKDKVIALAFSVDGVTIASTSWDKTIKLWDVTSGWETYTFNNRNPDINNIAFSPDGRLLASAETIWDVESKQVLYELDQGEGGKPSFSPDGKLLAVGGMRRPVKLWDVASGQVVRTFESQANNDTFTTLFSPDGHLLATSGYDGVIELWNVPSGKVERSLSYNTEIGIHSVAFSPDGSLLASGGTDRWVFLWNVKSGEVVHRLAQGDGLYGIAFSPDGRLVASAGCDRTVRLWDVETGKLVSTLRHKDEVVAVVFSPDGTLLVSGDYDNQIYLWGIPPTASNPTHTENHLSKSILPETAQQVPLVRTLTGHTDKVLALAFSGNGVYIASDSLDKTIRLWDVRSGQSVHTFSKGESEMIITQSIAFSPNGKLLASAEAIWDVKSGNIVHVLNAGQHAPVAFSPDGSLLAITLFNQPPKLWDVTSGQVADSFVVQPQNADNLSINLAFSPDGARVVAAGHLDGTVRLWDAHSGQIVRSLSHGTESNIHALAFSPDGHLLASAGTDATVRIWDLASGQQVHSLGHREGSWSVAFSPDGNLLASAGCDGTVQIWEVTSGKVLRTLDHKDQVTSVVFSPDGTLLVTGGYDNQVYLWGIPR